MANDPRDAVARSFVPVRSVGCDNSDLIDQRMALLTLRVLAEAASAHLLVHKGSEVDRDEMRALFDLVADVAHAAERDWMIPDAGARPTPNKEEA